MPEGPSFEDYLDFICNYLLSMEDVSPEELVKMSQTEADWAINKRFLSDLNDNRQEDTDR